MGKSRQRKRSNRSRRNRRAGDMSASQQGELDAAMTERRAEALRLAAQVTAAPATMLGRVKKMAAAYEKEHPGPAGGKRRKSRKHRKSKKSRKHRKSRKH